MACLQYQLIQVYMKIVFGENMSKQKFNKNNAIRANQIVQLVHSDLMGIFQVKSIEFHSYALTFIDGYIRMTFIYFLKNKSNCFEKLVHFKSLVENQIDYKIKMLRSSNGGEYISNEFHDFFSNVGIKCQLSISYTPQQNGVAKRKNRSIMDMASCMLGDLPKNLWVEAINIAIYILNRWCILLCSIRKEKEIG